MDTSDIEFTGVQELDNAQRNLKRALSNIADILSKTITLKLGQINRENMKAIKSVMMGSFQAIAYEEFQRVFYSYYGNNYDINSLNKSLIFAIDDNLCPHLSYNKKDFTLSKHFNEDARTFNQNARIEGGFKDLMGIDELDAMEEMDFYGLSFDEENPYDYATENMEPPEDYRVFKNKRLLLEPSEVYKKAENSALEAFRAEYEKLLKPYFNRKYGVRL